MIENTQTTLGRFLGYIGRLCLYEFLPAQRKIEVFHESQLKIFCHSVARHLGAFLDIRSSFLVIRSIGKTAESTLKWDFLILLARHPVWRGFFLGMTSMGLGMLIVRIV